MGKRIKGGEGRVVREKILTGDRRRQNHVWVSAFCHRAQNYAKPQFLLPWKPGKLFHVSQCCPR